MAPKIDEGDGQLKIEVDVAATVKNTPIRMIFRLLLQLFLISTSISMTITTPAFKSLVAVLKAQKKTLTVVEQCCGGLISSSILAQPGASAVFLGGSVSYNTKHSKPLLLNDDKLYQSLTTNPQNNPMRSEAEQYIQSKVAWTAKTSIAFCKALNTDFAIAEAGASGPTFRPNDMYTGFAVICVAGKDADGHVTVLEQNVIHSDSNEREKNMRLFADRAAELAESVALQRSDSKKSVSTKKLDFDRAVHLRSDPQALAAMRDSAKYLILLQGSQILLNSPTEPALLDHETVMRLFPGQHPQTFLGVLTSQETALFSIDLNENDTRFDLPYDMSFADTRTTAPLFSAFSNEIALHATALAQWQRRTKFCSTCGGSIRFLEGGTSSICNQCHAKAWPRQDPSIIVLISSRDGKRVLLAKSPRHPEKMYTVLAGFVEAGESFEAAVARETFEETGVIVDEGSIQYCGSQPWPFPQSCMIGFIATADDSTPLTIDNKEIVDAKWFDRYDVDKAGTVPGATMQKVVASAALEKDPTLKLLIPPQGVIARRLIDQWLAQRFLQ